MSPKSRGRPADRGRQKPRRQGPTRPIRLSDQVIKHARDIAAIDDVLDNERWASGWLGDAWHAAPIGDRDAEHTLCMEVVGRVCTNPSPHGLAAVAALRRVVAPSEHKLLDETIDILTEDQPAPPWFDAPPFEPVRAWRAVDVWDSERVLFIEYAATDGAATAHTLMAQIFEVGGTAVEKLGILRSGAALAWESMRDPDEVPMPLTEFRTSEALADLARCLERTDMLWPRHDDEDFVDTRALAWARCRAYVSDRPPWEPVPDKERTELIETFVHDAPPGADLGVLRSLADLFIDFGDGYLHTRPLGWSPQAVAMFLADWLPRKAVLDPAQRHALPAVLRQWIRFALNTRGVAPEWIDPVVAAVDTWQPAFAEAFDDETAWGPAKQVVTALEEQGVDLTDRGAVEAAVRGLNAENLARRLTDER